MLYTKINDLKKMNILSNVYLSIMYPCLEPCIDSSSFFRLYCGEEQHRYEELFRESLEKFIKQQSVSKQLECLKYIYDMFASPSGVPPGVRFVSNV